MEDASPKATYTEKVDSLAKTVYYLGRKVNCHDEMFDAISSQLSDITGHLAKMSGNPK